MSRARNVWIVEVDNAAAEINKVVQDEAVTNIDFHLHKFSVLHAPEIEYLLEISYTRNLKDSYVMQVFMEKEDTDLCTPDHIFSFYANNTTLRALKVSYHSSVDVSFDKIEHLLKNNTALKVLQVYNENLKDSDLDTFSKGLLFNRSLELISIYGNSFSRPAGANLLKTLYCSPYFELEQLLLDIHNTETIKDAKRVADDIKEVLNLNHTVKLTLQGQAAVMWTAQFISRWFVRCYNMSPAQFDDMMTFMQQQNVDLKSIGHVFIYNTPMDRALFDKWFSKDALGENLQTVTMINCNARFDYFVDPAYVDHLTRIKVLYLIN